MIRVIYRWTVDPAESEAFVSSWRHATKRILSEEPGAMGSTLLRPIDEPDAWLGLARWRSRADLEAFWASGRAVALPGATFRSAEVLDEHTNFTIEEHPTGRPSQRPSR
jgi:heme-degrading monooxygenase HmoA